jgi:hypothetical protein
LKSRSSAAIFCDDPAAKKESRLSPAPGFSHDAAVIPGGCQVPSPGGRIDGGSFFGQ